MHQVLKNYFAVRGALQKHFYFGSDGCGYKLVQDKEVEEFLRAHEFNLELFAKTCRTQGTLCLQAFSFEKGKLQQIQGVPRLNLNAFLEALVEQITEDFPVFPV